MNAIAQPSAASLSGSKLDNRRMLAALIDLAIVGVGAATIMVAAGVAGGDGATVGAPLAGVALCWALYYYFACESGGGQTLGKKVAGVRVVRVDGSAAGMREIAVRTALRVVDTALMGLIAMLATGERRARLGDLAAGTMIVSTDATEAGAPSAAAAAPAQAAATPLPDVPTPAEATPVATQLPEAPAAAGATPDFNVLAPAEATPLSEVPAPDEASDLDASPMTRLVEAPPATGEAPAVPELRPFEPFAERAEPETAASDDEPAVELSVVQDPPVELSVVETPVEDEAVADDPPSSPENNVLDLTTPSLKELAEDVAAASDWGRPTIEPIEDTEPEPLVAIEPDPVDEVEAGPVVDAEPVLEVEPEPVAEVEPEPVVDAEPVVDVEPIVEVEPAEVTVRSVETVSAIDLIMGEQEPGQGPPAGDDPAAGAA